MITSLSTALPGYAELHCLSNFTFLRGASSPESLVAQAITLGYHALAITDECSLAGLVRAHLEAKKSDLKLLIGTELRIDPSDQPAYKIVLLAQHREGYGNLCEVITRGRMQAVKGQYLLRPHDVVVDGCLAILVPQAEVTPADLSLQLTWLTQHFSNRCWVALSRLHRAQENLRLQMIQTQAQTHHIPCVAVGQVEMHKRSRKALHDILAAIRLRKTIAQCGYDLASNAEQHLRTRLRLSNLYQPELLLQTICIAERCHFSLDELRYEYPEEVVPKGYTAAQYLHEQTWQGAVKRYPTGIPDNVGTQINHELALITELGYETYFLTVYDLVQFAVSRHILCQGRGSAANSAVCYCLGITAVNPANGNALFERFISRERNEPPDIDVDFEHERREEVMQYIYEKYGRDRAAIVATVTQLHSKGAVRDVGKAMGLSVDTLNILSATVSSHYDEGFDRERLVAHGLNPDDPLLKKTLELTSQMVGFPRQLGQHTGGFIITQGKLTDLCPTLNARMENRTCIEWNKDDIEALGFLKVDVLALGMLTCIRKAFTLTKNHYQKDYNLHNIPHEDGNEVYQMISRADTLGVFQIESRAQMSMLPRLKPMKFYDLVIEVAIVRPGPIQGDMVHPYLRRRNGEEEVEYPSDELREILGKTFGVPLFQEQAMEVAIVAAGFTPTEADELRRSMATFKAVGKVTDFKKKLLEGMHKKGYEPDFAERLFKQIEGFGGYGFPESHAASFALLVYISSYLKCIYPDVFATALLNSMPMGFYQPAQIVIDAEKHGVTVLPIDINHSEWDNTLTDKVGDFCAIRLGFRQAKGLAEEEVNFLVSQRQSGYKSLAALRDIGISQSTLEKLADADAFRSMNMDRRDALWHISALHDRPIALFERKADNSQHETQISLPLMPTSEHVIHDYAHVGLSLKAHPVSFIRKELEALRVLSTQTANEAKDGEKIKVAGLILVRQRPGTASGICFITIEDETGIANLVVYQKLFNQFRKEILGAKLLMIEGKVQREGEVVHIVVQRCHNYNGLLQQLHGSKTRNIPPTMGEKVFHDGRNFK